MLGWSVTTFFLCKFPHKQREINFKQNIVPDTKIDDRTALCDAYTLPTELACPPRTLGSVVIELRPTLQGNCRQSINPF